MSLNRPLNEIDEKVLLELISNQVSEGKEIDYKRDAIGNSDGEKKEFLFDVSSFANAAGGHLLIGMDEENGFPTRLAGIEVANLDAEKNRIDNLILSSIRPRIVPGFQLHPVEIQGSSRVVLVIRVRKSITMPHMVTFRDTNKFYSRNSHGKYLLDVGEIRNLFNLSESTIQKIKNFRTERISQIVADETPVPLRPAGKVVLHIVPLRMTDPAANVDLDLVNSNRNLFPCVEHVSDWNRYNFDGFLAYNLEGDRVKARTYTQLFRDGTIEAVETFTLAGKDIPGVAFEKTLVQSLGDYLNLQKFLGVSPPLYVMVSFLGVKGRSMTLAEHAIPKDTPTPIDKEDLMIQENTITDLEMDPAIILRPVFDAIWNASGYAKSPHYDENGKWSVET